MASKKRQTILLHGASQASPVSKASPVKLRFVRFQGHAEPNNRSDNGHKKRQIILLHGALRSLRASHRGAAPATAGGGNPGDMENGLSALFVTNIAKERL